MGFDVNPTSSGVGFGIASGIVNLFVGNFSWGGLFAFFDKTSATGEVLFSCNYTPPIPLQGRISCGQVLDMTAAKVNVVATKSPPNADGAKTPEVDRSKGFLDDPDHVIQSMFGGDASVMVGVPPPPSADRSFVGMRA